MNKSLKSIIKLAYDLHVHVGPEIIPRKYTPQTLAENQAGKIAGCVLKNHFYPTAAMFDNKSIKGIDLYGSIVLNNAVGGLNTEAVYAASLVAKKPLVVWLPTINSEQFLIKNKYEIAPEWVKDKSLKLKPSSETRAVVVTKNGRLSSKAKATIQMIAQVGGVLATGHIASNESILVAKYARSLGVSVIVTHPIYQHIQMPIAQQQELAEIGCFIEHTYSMFSMDGISIKKIATQIKAVGAKSVILTSDVGQPFSLSPSEALKKFAELLINESISLEDIETMLVKNPKQILSIK